ncbi:MAG: aromatic ring-hydroxylating oxygenase subunit alpha [Flavobacteriaceae bacterium]
MAEKFHIDEDIRKSQTLPSSFYSDQSTFERIRDKIFYRSWQWIGDKHVLKDDHTAHPFVLLDGYLTEPMLLTHNGKGDYHCLSNVCTHRGNIVISKAGAYRNLNCGYHGRRFGIDGNFEFMPEFNEVEDFPANCDHLHKFPLANWGPWFFAGLNPVYDIEAVLKEINTRVGFLSLDEFKYLEERGKEYTVNAHWALYCDNYLEGFHIPFVHNDLNAVLDYGNYETVLFDHMSLQIGYAEGTEELFDLPRGHIDYGKKIAAYYFWVFPNMMFNFYPWGLSVNVVEPLKIDKTRVRFLSYVYDESKLNRGAGAGLDKVEKEDEEVVEGVQIGIRSRFYKAGRFSPSKEKGVHHFHRLLAEFLNAE